MDLNTKAGLFSLLFYLALFAGTGLAHHLNQRKGVRLWLANLAGTGLALALLALAFFIRFS